MPPTLLTGPGAPFTTCPVCGWAHLGVADRCLVDPATLDPSAVAAARLRHDLVAALRVEGRERGLPSTAVPAVPAAAAWCRGWQTLATDERSAHLAAAHLHVGRPRPSTDAESVEVVRAGVARLMSGTVERLALVGIGVDGLDWCAVGLDARGEPVVLGDPGTADVWARLLPPGVGGPRRSYLIAGGREDGAPSCGWPDVARCAEDLVREVGVADPGTEYLLLRGDAGFLMVDVLATALTGLVPPAAEVRVEARPDPAGWARRWAGAAPLRRAYDLVCAELDVTSGAARPVLVPLFPAGVEPGRGVTPTVTLTLEASDGRSGQVQLPIVVGVQRPESGPPVVPPDAPVLTVATAAVAGPTAVRFELQAPGAVLVDDAATYSGRRAATAPWASPTWGELADRLPRHLSHDVVVAVELCGLPDVVTERIRVAEQLVGALRARDEAMPGAVRVAAIGYSDHRAEPASRSTPRSGRGPEPAVAPTTGFLTPADLEAMVTSWTWSPIVTPWGTALEDALQAAAHLPWGSEQRSLIVIGSRPPSESALGSTKGHRCPHGINWRYEASRLRNAHVRFVVVDDRHAWPSEPFAPVPRTEAVWADLAANGDRHPLSKPDLVSALIGIITPGSTSPVRLSRVVGSEVGHV